MIGGAIARPLVVRETGPADSPRPRLLDRVRAALRARHYSRRTESPNSASGSDERSRKVRDRLAALLNVDEAS